MKMKTKSIGNPDWMRPLGTSEFAPGQREQSRRCMRIGDQVWRAGSASCGNHAGYLPDAVKSARSLRCTDAGRASI